MAKETQREVAHFGVIDCGNDVRILAQTGGFYHPQFEPDFGITVKTGKTRQRCPHDFPVHDVDLPDVSVNDFTEFSKWFLPIPPTEGRKAVYLVGKPDLVWLTNLCCPSRSAAHAAWNISMSRISVELSTTNLSPLVLFDFSGRLSTELRDLVKLADWGVRRLICVGSPDVILPSYLESHTWTPTPTPTLDAKLVGTKILRDYLNGTNPPSLSNGRSNSVHAKPKIY
ncbi:MAG: hypothetical protein WCO00_06075 [Rhodospirillaceae bacterium]